MSENIRVRSLIGRYLEHSRVYYFANGEAEGKPQCYIGSADLMPRNLDRRIEALVPISEPNLRAVVMELLTISLADDTLAWRLDDQGDWWPLVDAAGMHQADTHLRLHEFWAARAQPVQ